MNKYYFNQGIRKKAKTKCTATAHSHPFQLWIVTVRRELIFALLPILAGLQMALVGLQMAAIITSLAVN